MEKADVTIIGAGAIGCAIAYFLSKEGLKTIVVEQDSIGAHASELDAPSMPRRLTTVDDLVLSVVKYQGEVEEHHCHHGSELLLVHENSLTLRTDLGTVTLDRGEMTVVPKGVSYRVQAPEGALVLLVAKSRSEQDQY